jgi:hypothetical protein
MEFQVTSGSAAVTPAHATFPNSICPPCWFPASHAANWQILSSPGMQRILPPTWSTINHEFGRQLDRKRGWAINEEEAHKTTGTTGSHDLPLKTWCCCRFHLRMDSVLPDGLGITLNSFANCEHFIGYFCSKKKKGQLSTDNPQIRRRSYYKIRSICKNPLRKKCPVETKLLISQSVQILFRRYIRRPFI